MELKLAFKTAFPYGFSAFFIDTRLVNRVGTASLVRPGGHSSFAGTLG